MGFIFCQNRTISPFRGTVKLHFVMFIVKVPKHDSCIKIWRAKCNGKYLKHMADGSDCTLALYHLNEFILYNNECVYIICASP